MVEGQESVSPPDLFFMMLDSDAEDRSSSFAATAGDHGVQGHFGRLLPQHSYWAAGDNQRESLFSRFVRSSKFYRPFWQGDYWLCAQQHIKAGAWVARCQRIPEIPGNSIRNPQLGMTSSQLLLLFDEGVRNTHEHSQSQKQKI